MSTEDRLRNALKTRAATVNPSDDGWNRIEARMNAPRRFNAKRITTLAAAVAAAAAAAVFAITQNGNGTPIVAGNPATTSTTAPPATSTTSSTSTTSTTAASVNSIRGPSYIYPWIPGPDKTRFDTPTALAEGFGRDFLGMTNPTVGAYRSGDAHSGEIDIRSTPRGVATTLLVREDANGWNALAASSPNLVLDRPTTYDEIRSPATLRGKSVAFEGTVHVTLLTWGTSMRCVPATDTCGSEPRVLANYIFTGHGSELTPFETTLRFAPNITKTAVLVLWTDSAEDGSLFEATVRLVRLAS
ncbi:MAG: hypothetical protein H0U92_02860 [Actinobacteria bacterium]|nr:hypothetical protein [Actinomycetota bacterium]